LKPCIRLRRSVWLGFSVLLLLAWTALLPARQCYAQDQQAASDQGACTAQAYSAMGPAPTPPALPNGGGSTTQFNGQFDSGESFSGSATTTNSSHLYGAPEGAMLAQEQIAYQQAVARYRAALLNIYRGCLAERAAQEQAAATGNKGMTANPMGNFIGAQPSQDRRSGTEAQQDQQEQNQQLRDKEQQGGAGSTQSASGLEAAEPVADDFARQVQSIQNVFLSACGLDPTAEPVSVCRPLAALAAKAQSLLGAVQAGAISEHDAEQHLKAARDAER
jgi:hypothetical protein